MWKREIPVVSDGIGLHTPDDAFLKTRRFRNVAQKQFIRAVHIFDASPHIVAFREAAGCVAAASSPPGVGPAGLSEGQRVTMKA